MIVTVRLVALSALVAAAPAGAWAAECSTPAHGTTPLVVAIADDRTQSKNDNGIVHLTPPDLEPLIEAVCGRGGEILVQPITDDSARDAPIHLKLDPPPPSLVLEPLPRNPFQRSRVLTRQLELKRSHEAALADWSASRADRVARFRTQLQAHCERPLAGRTDVAAAMQRISIWLAQPRTGSPQLACVVVSDCQDNVRRPLNWSPPACSLIVVNGLPTAGLLQSLSPRRFATLEAAVEDVVAAPAGVAELRP